MTCEPLCCNGNVSCCCRLQRWSRGGQEPNMGWCWAPRGVEMRARCSDFLFVSSPRCSIILSLTKAVSEAFTRRLSESTPPTHSLCVCVCVFTGCTSACMRLSMRACMWTWCVRLSAYAYLHVNAVVTCVLSLEEKKKIEVLALRFLQCPCGVATKLNRGDCGRKCTSQPFEFDFP